MAADDLVKQTQQQSLETLPDDLKQHSGAGTENIGENDVKPAQLKICQAGTPQRKTDDPKQIMGLQELDLFNDLSGEIYGRKLEIIVISMLGHRNVEFMPGELGTVLDRDVPDNDPRAQWPVDAQGRSLKDEKGKRVKPAATKFYNYLLWLPKTSDVVVLSLSSTQIPVAVKLNGLLKLPLKIGGNIVPKPPAWSRTFEISTFMDKDGDLSWGALNLRLVGVTDQQTRELCATLHAAYSTKTVEVEYAAPAREPGDDDFDTAAMDAEVAEGT